MMAEADTEENVYGEAVAESPVAPPNGDINIDDLLPDGPQGNIQGQMEEFLGPQPEYDEEEEEKKYYRRKKLGVVKNVLGASVGGMIIYSVYMGNTCLSACLCVCLTDCLACLCVSVCQFYSYMPVLPFVYVMYSFISVCVCVCVFVCRPVTDAADPPL
uniref:Uncharacterized protein n=2 Tax=Hucho hucho TaxID=62062 RepID=A0A4W5M0R1_9TELE